jgi:hypothetical protein
MPHNPAAKQDLKQLTMNLNISRDQYTQPNEEAIPRLTFPTNECVQWIDISITVC